MTSHERAIKDCSVVSDRSLLTDNAKAGGMIEHKGLARIWQMPEHAIWISVNDDGGTLWINAFDSLDRTKSMQGPGTRVDPYATTDEEILKAIRDEMDVLIRARIKKLAA